MNGTLARTATGWIAGLTVAAWLLVAAVGLDLQAAVAGGFIPVRITYRLEGEGMLPALLTPLTATLLHGGLLHLGLNMLMLVVCGLPVERAIGFKNFVGLYLAGAIAAAAAQWAGDPTLQAPMIGASGAISAIVAGYALLFGRSRVRIDDPRLARAIHVLWLAASWIGLQFLIGYATQGTGDPAIATLAHVGGFLAGLVLIKPLHRLHWRKA